uniref:Uncharacterized protein n=1 Tax=Anguilla anguilla TaxID=7936 RepID=A0A0E9STK7_ANGAN
MPLSMCIVLIIIIYQSCKKQEKDTCMLLKCWRIQLNIYITG